MRRIIFTLTALVALAGISTPVEGQLYPYNFSPGYGISLYLQAGHDSAEPEYHRVGGAWERDEGTIGTGMVKVNWLGTYGSVACVRSSGAWPGPTVTCLSGIGYNCPEGTTGDRYLSAWGKTTDPDTQSAQGHHLHDCGGGGEIW